MITTNTDAHYLRLAQERVGVVPREGQTPEEYAELITRIASSLRASDIAHDLRAMGIGVLFVDAATHKRLVERGMSFLDVGGGDRVSPRVVPSRRGRAPTSRPVGGKRPKRSEAEIEIAARELVARIPHPATDTETQIAERLGAAIEGFRAAQRTGEDLVRAGLRAVRVHDDLRAAAESIDTEVASDLFNRARNALTPKGYDS